MVPGSHQRGSARSPRAARRRGEGGKGGSGLRAAEQGIDPVHLAGDETHTKAVSMACPMVLEATIHPLADPPRQAVVHPPHGMNPHLEAADFCTLRKKEPLVTPSPVGVEPVCSEAGHEAIHRMSSISLAKACEDFCTPCNRSLGDSAVQKTCACLVPKLPPNRQTRQEARIGDVKKARLREPI